MEENKATLPYKRKMIEYRVPDVLTRRDQFAMAAMQGLLSAIYSNKEMLNEFTTDKSGGFKRYVTGCKAITENALSYADALIAALDEKKKEDGE